MKYIITENQMDRAVLKYLNTKYGDLESYKPKKYPNHIFFMKDGKVIFSYNKENGLVFISDDHIWSLLDSFFGLEIKGIKYITKTWVEEHYKLNVSTTLIRIDKQWIEIEEDYKLKNPHR